MNSKRKRRGTGLPAINKSVKDFLLSEEGRISSKGVLKIGLALAIVGALPGSRAEAQHTSYFFQDQCGGAGGHSSNTA